MTQKIKGKKFCIKTIKGNHYVYSWSYRPKYLRTKRKSQRYSWEYIGNYKSNSVQKLLKRLPFEKQGLLRVSYEKKIKAFEIEQELMQAFESQEPYKSEKERILRINNRDNHINEMSQYVRNLRVVINQHISEQ